MNRERLLTILIIACVIVLAVQSIYVMQLTRLFNEKGEACREFTEYLADRCGCSLDEVLNYNDDLNLNSIFSEEILQHKPGYIANEVIE